MAKLKNERQEKFCLEYIKTDSQRQAAVNAGYSIKTADSQASRMLNNVKFKHVQDRYKELLDKFPKKNKLIADVEEVLEFFSNTIRNKLKAKELNDEGETVEIDINVETKDRLKAAELLGKKYAMFTENVNVDVKISEIEGLTDEELDTELTDYDTRAKDKKS